MWKKNLPTVKQVQYPLAADANGAVAKVYGMYQEDSGLAVRARFIIDPDGLLKAVKMLIPPVGRNVNELIRQIKALQAVAQNPGKAAPAEWQPGDKLIALTKNLLENIESLSIDFC